MPPPPRAPPAPSRPRPRRTWPAPGPAAGGAARPPRSVDVIGRYPPYFFLLAASSSLAFEVAPSRAALGDFLPSTASLTASSKVGAVISPMPGTAGGNLTYSSCWAAMFWTSSSWNSGLSRTDALAAIWPALAQSIEWSLIQEMNTLDAWSLLGSFWAWEVTTKLCELAQTAGWSPIWGSGAAPHSRPLTLAHSFIIQMPSQVRAFLPCRKATAWASLATFLGL